MTYLLILTLLYFFFLATATPDIYTLSLHDALPISFRPINLPSSHAARPVPPAAPSTAIVSPGLRLAVLDRKSTRLNSSHQIISYAVFCLKKKKKKKEDRTVATP